MSDSVSRIVSDGTTYDIVDANAVHTTDTVTTSQIADGAVTEDKLGEDVTDQITALQDSVSQWEFGTNVLYAKLYFSSTYETLCVYFDRADGKSGNVELGTLHWTD